MVKAGKPVLVQERVLALLEGVRARVRVLVGVRVLEPEAVLGLELEPVQVLAGVRVVVRVPEMVVGPEMVREMVLVEQVRAVLVRAWGIYYPCWGNPADAVRSKPLTLQMFTSTTGNLSSVEQAIRTDHRRLSGQINQWAACLRRAVTCKIQLIKMTNTRTLGIFMTGKTIQALQASKITMLLKSC